MARKIVVVFGLVIALLPYIGLPEAVDTTLFTVLGLLVSFLAWSGRRSSERTEIEKMEEELRSDLHPTGLSLPTEKDTGAASNTENGSSEEDKELSVSFDRRRLRNLKKRITQEPS